VSLSGCLRQNHVGLPSTAGKGHPAGAGGSQPKKGATQQAQLQAALKKCAGVVKPRLPKGNSAGRSGGAVGAIRPQASAKFASCMREHGVDVPAANTSGKGPHGTNTGSPTFKTAFADCLPVLRGSPPAKTGASGPPRPPSAGAAAP